MGIIEIALSIALGILIFAGALYLIKWIIIIIELIIEYLANLFL